MSLLMMNLFTSARNPNHVHTCFHFRTYEGVFSYGIGGELVVEEKDDNLTYLTFVNHKNSESAQFFAVSIACKK